MTQPERPTPPPPNDGLGRAPRTRREARDAYARAQRDAARRDERDARAPETAAAPVATQAHPDETPHADDHPFAWSLRADAPPPEPPRRRRRRGVRIAVVTLIILALLGGGAAFAWFTFQPQIDKLAAAMQPNDYTGQGTGSVQVTIQSGDAGSDVADRLAKAGVVKTSDAFYRLLLQTKPDPVFQPGVYQLKKQMSAKAALAALQNPKNRLERTVSFPEGTRQADILTDIAKATSIPLAQLQAEAAQPASFGLPTGAKNLEGFLFPATYTFSPNITAHDALKTMVDRAYQSLDKDGVAPADRWRVVTLASIVQAEAGPNLADFGKIARVFQNRLDTGMPLQSDATVKYGVGETGVFTTDAQRQDPANTYNTYVHLGLPPGPIGNPGDTAIQAALHPTPGSWLYFVTVNLKTGQTEFSTTLQEHDAAVQQLQQWCNASSANDAYCK